MRFSPFLFISACLFTSQVFADKIQILIRCRYTPGSELKTVTKTITIAEGRAEYVINNIVEWSDSRFRGVTLNSGINRVTNNFRVKSRTEATEAISEVERLIHTHLSGIRKRAAGEVSATERVQIFIQWKPRDSTWKSTSGLITLPTERAQYVLDHIGEWSQHRFRGIRLKIGTYRVTNNIRLTTRAEGVGAWNECDRIIREHVSGIRKRAPSVIAPQADEDKVQISINWKHSPQSKTKNISGMISVPEGRAQYVLDNIAAWSQAKYRGVRLVVGTYRVVNSIRIRSRADALEAWNECERIIQGHVGGTR